MMFANNVIDLRPIKCRHDRQHWYIREIDCTRHCDACDEEEQPMFPRDLNDVINRLLAVIPATETVLRERLVSAQKIVLYHPPEMHGYDWQIVSSALNVAGWPPKETWQLAAYNVFCGRDYEEPK
jgi:hypothetical protein